MNTEDQVAYTIPEWCGNAKFCVSLYHKLQRQGLGPRVVRVGVRERTSPKRRAHIPSAVNWKPNLQSLPLWRLCDSTDQTAEKALLARLCAGDVLAAQGKLKIGTYEKDGQTALPTYAHVYEDGRRVQAKAYPENLLADFRRHFREEWLPIKAIPYFKDRDPLALPFFPKLLPTRH